MVKHADYLKALEINHKKYHVHIGQSSKYMVAVILGFFISLLFLKIQYVFLMFGTITAFVFLFKKDQLIHWQKNRVFFEQNHSRLLLKVFTSITNEIAPRLNLRLNSPNIKTELVKSGLLTDRVEFVVSSGSFSGLWNSSIPYCASYVSAGHYVKSKNSNNDILPSQNIHFKGFIFFMDFKETEFNIGSAATNRIAILEKLALLKNKFSKDEIRFTFLETTFVALIPKGNDPFTLSNDSKFWSKDFIYFNETVKLVADLIIAVETCMKSIDSEAM